MPKAMDDDDTPAASAVTVNVNRSGAVRNQTPTREIEFTEQTSDFALAQEHWFKTFWRPAMGWLYMAICAFDFILFPIGAMVLPTIYPTMHYLAWDPITLKSGGLIHLAFGAVLGITAWGRSKEKITGAVSQA